MIPPKPRRRRADRNLLAVTGILWLVALTKIFVVRPPLNARSDVIVAGGDPGESILHYLYIGLDVLTLATLIVLTVMASKRALAAPDTQSHSQE